MPGIDLPQIRALVAAVRPTGSGKAAFALRTDPVWPGPEEAGTVDGGLPLRVLACPSPLAVRAALVDHSDDDVDEVLVMLTSCKDSDLGPDVLARLAKGRILSIDPFAAVLGLFRASVLDPELTQEQRWLIDELIERAPAGGWPADRPVSGVLDVELAWRVWHRERLGGEHDVPDTLADVLGLAGDGRVGAALAALAPEQRAKVGQRWAMGAPAAAVMADLMAAGHGPDLLAWGLVVDVVWGVTDDPSLANDQTIARVRLEPLLGRDRLDHRAAAAWAEAAVALIDEAGLATPTADRAEHLLRDISSESLQVLSDHLQPGFEQRLDVLAARLTAGDLPGCEAALAWLARHRAAGRRAQRLAAAQAAVRLVRRRASTRPKAGSFPELVRAYAAEGAWVDTARQLLAEGDTNPSLATALRGLCAEVDAERRADDLAFARTLAEWSAAEPLPNEWLVPVEEVLARVAAPVAAVAPVLVMVCDGMSLPTAYELLDDLGLEGWTPVVPAGRDSWPHGVAMLPTVTEVSRTSLICGARVEGTQVQEKPGFAAHPALRQASAGQRMPILFHNADLPGPAGTALSPQVREAIVDPTQRVVGVVVNAIDDQLAKRSLMTMEWTLEGMKAVRWLLEAAAEGQRMVLLTADHGHVLHGEGAEYRQSGEGGGERWRTPHPPAGDGEVEVAGPRVLKGGRVVLPADDRIRYSPTRHGYHGGATPQEVVVPVTVLARSLPDGWERRPLQPPAWWAAGPVVPSAVPVGADAAAVAPSVAAKPKPRRPEAQPALFEEPTVAVSPAASPVAGPAPSGVASWVDALLGSPTFAGQRDRVRLPRPMPDERVASYLRALDANGGTLEMAALAARVGEPADQLRMALTLVQRLVNLDGAEVLAVRGNSTVALNLELLRMQFELDAP